MNGQPLLSNQQNIVTMGLSCVTFLDIIHMDEPMYGFTDETNRLLSTSLGPSRISGFRYGTVVLKTPLEYIYRKRRVSLG